MCSSLTILRYVVLSLLTCSMKKIMIICLPVALLLCGFSIHALLPKKDTVLNHIALHVTNLQTSTGQFAKFTAKINDGKLGKALDSTMLNVQNATKGLNENMEAAKNNILLRGYFRKKKKADAKKAAELKKQEAVNKKNGISTKPVNVKDSIKQ